MATSTSSGNNNMKASVKQCWLWKNVKCKSMEIDGKRPCNNCDWHSIYINQENIEDYVSYDQAIKKETIKID
jgi:hypothetical protein